MENLIVCSCGHHVGEHGENGCHWCRRSRTCALTAAEVIDAAVTTARQRPPIGTYTVWRDRERSA